MLKKIGKGIIIIFGLVILYLLTWPTGIDPVVWTPQKAPSLTGEYAPNNLLSKTEILGRGMGVDPEDIDADGSNGVEFVDTKGRPLGLEFDANGNLIHPLPAWKPIRAFYTLAV